MRAQLCLECAGHAKDEIHGGLDPGAIGMRAEKQVGTQNSLDQLAKVVAACELANQRFDQLVGRRFRLIDSEFRRLAPNYPNSVVIDRDGMEFHTRDGLMRIIEIAGLPPFRDIPYRQMDRYSSR